MSLSDEGRVLSPSQVADLFGSMSVVACTVAARSASFVVISGCRSADIMGSIVGGAVS